MKKADKEATERLVDEIGPTASRAAECRSEIASAAALVKMCADKLARVPSPAQFEKQVRSVSKFLRRKHPLVHGLLGVSPEIAETAADSIVKAKGSKPWNDIGWVAKLKAKELVHSYSRKSTETKINEVGKMILKLATGKRAPDLSTYQVSDDRATDRVEPRLVLRIPSSGLPRPK